MKSWYDIYLEEIDLKGNIVDYINYKIRNKKKLINLIKKYSPNKKIMEAGAGTGIISTYMSSLGYDVTEIDIDSQIQSLATKISNEYIKGTKPKFVQKDILELDYDLKYFDVIFSNGVLEHFTDVEIIKILSLQLKQSNYVIFGIPTIFFNQNEALHGDERFLTVEKWRDLIRKSNGIIVEESSYDYRTIKEKILGFNKFFKVKPFKLFVIKSDK